MARTNLPDLLFAFESDNLIYGRTNNPYDESRSSGGSSGGEAALIAACGSPFGLGSDAAGSVRLPAHFCGIAAIKPTSGRLPRTGHVPPAGGWVESLWQIGPMARRVEDLCAMMAILTRPDGQDHTVVPVPYRDPLEVEVAGLRIAWFAENGIAAPTRETAALVRRAAEALGAEECRPPRIEESYDLEMKLLGLDGGDGLRAYLREIGSTRTHPLLDGWLNKLAPYRTGVEGFAEYWESLYGFRAGDVGVSAGLRRHPFASVRRSRCSSWNVNRRRHVSRFQLHHDVQRHRLARRRGALRRESRGSADRSPDCRPPLARRCRPGRSVAPRRVIRRLETRWDRPEQFVV